MIKDEFLYQQTYEAIKEKIYSGEYQVDSKMPTEEELKAALGVSIITVKKALSMLVDEGLVRRIPGKGTFVLNFIRPSDPAQGYPSHLIGAVFEHAATPFALDMMYQMDKELEKAGYKLCLRFSYGNRDKETQEIQFLLSLGVKGLIVMPSHGEHYNPEILKLFLARFPIILIDKKLDGIPIPSVRTDNAGAVAGLVRALVERGCRNIAYVSTDEMEATSIKERQQGFQSEILTLRLPEFPSCMVPHKVELTKNESGSEEVQAIRDYLQIHGAQLDGVVCLEYSMLLALVPAARSMGIKLDQDLHVAAIDEDYLAPDGYRFMHMKQDEITIATQAVAMLLKWLQRNDIVQEDCLVPAIFYHKSEAFPVG